MPTLLTKKCYEQGPSAFGDTEMQTILLVVVPGPQIQRQLELYNSHDLDAFMQLMADDVVAVDGITGVVIGSGVEALRPRYEARFASRRYMHGGLLFDDVGHV